MTDMIDWRRDDTVVLHRVPTDGAPSYAEYREASLQLLDVLQVPIEQKKVTLKPNVVHGVEPDSGITVHPGFMRGIIDHLIARGFEPGAITMAEGSELVREALGDHVFEYLIRNKREEWDAYRAHVTPYELERYLPLL